MWFFGLWQVQLVDGRRRLTVESSGLPDLVVWNPGLWIGLAPTSWGSWPVSG